MDRPEADKISGPAEESNRLLKIVSESDCGPEVDPSGPEDRRSAGGLVGKRKAIGVSWSREERIADELPAEWETGAESDQREWLTADDRSEAKANDEDMPPLMNEPRCKDQMVQVPISRLPSNTKRCVLTMDGYSYVIGEYGINMPVVCNDIIVLF